MPMDVKDGHGNIISIATMDDLMALVGPLTAPAIDTPDAPSAATNSLLRGIISVLLQGNLPLPVDDTEFAQMADRLFPGGGVVDEENNYALSERHVGAFRITPSRQVIMTPQPHTKGGLSSKINIDLNVTPFEIKDTAAQLYGFYAANRSTSTIWVRFYDLADQDADYSAPKVGPIAIPARSDGQVIVLAGFGGLGIEFPTGLSARATASFEHADATALTANTCIFNAFYK